MVAPTDPMSEEQLDYGEDDYGGPQRHQYSGGPGAAGTIPALADEDMIGDDDEYDDLYNDVNVGEGFIQTLQQQRFGPPAQPAPPPLAAIAFSNGNQKVEGKESDPKLQMGSTGFQGGSAAPIPQKLGMDPGIGNGPRPAAPPLVSTMAGTGIAGNRPPPMVDDLRQVTPPVDNNGPTMLYVGELHWWTTDADLENALSQYGRVKEIKFFDERASGKSKGYCQVEFYESAVAAACKEGMNGHVFNGRACVVAFASPQSLKQMAGGFANKNQAQAQAQAQMPGRRAGNDGIGRGGGGMNFQGGDGGRNFGRGGWGGRGGQGMLNRAQGGGGPMRGRGAMGAKGMAGAAVGPCVQGLAGAGMGMPPGGLMHPQNMMGVGFDPTFMGRGGPYGGFGGPAFPGMMPPFQAVNPVGLPGVAPHFNPAFFGRGMAPNGMGMMGGGMDGQSAGMWNDPNMGGWNGEEHGRGTRESSYGGDDAGSDYGHGEVNHERGGRSNTSKEKERGSQRDWQERRHRDEREQDWDRSNRERHREEKDGYRDHRQKDRDRDHEDEWNRGQASSRSRTDHRSRSQDVDYGKRRRVPSE